MSEPLHDQIAKTLRRTLETGQWRKGQRLPTERALASDLGCAVGTLRKALAVIEQEPCLPSLALCATARNHCARRR